MDVIRERRELRQLLGRMPRSKKQTNGFFEADTEIIKRGPRDWLVSSTDSIGEEITQKLYVDPETWGWMAVMSSVSDLAATAADAIGLLVSAQWAYRTTDSTKKRFYNGVRAALEASQVCLLGGDSGSALDHVFTTTILGASATRPLTRIGAKAGDVVILLGPPRLGAGPALALRYLGGYSPNAFAEGFFRPRPNPRQAANWRDVASASIDTSDGLAASLALLGNLNRVGFDLDWREDILDPEALKFCRKKSLPSEILCTSDHGDFQTLLCVPPKKLEKMKDRDYVRIGEVTSRSGRAFLRMRSGRIEIPLRKIANAGRDLPAIRRLTDEMMRYFNEAQRR